MVVYIHDPWSIPDASFVYIQPIATSELKQLCKLFSVEVDIKRNTGEVSTLTVCFISRLNKLM